MATMKKFFLLPDRLTFIKLIVLISFVAVCAAAGIFACRPATDLSSSVSVNQANQANQASPPASPAGYPTPSPVINNPQVPADVDIPAGFPGTNGVEYFYDNSWGAFVGPVWAGRNGPRG